MIALHSYSGSCVENGLGGARVEAQHLVNSSGEAWGGMRSHGAWSKVVVRDMERWICLGYVLQVKQPCGVSILGN